MVNTRKHDKEGFIEYMEMFKQENSIVKSSIGEKMDFFKMTKEFKKLHEVEDADEINNIKGNAFEAWSEMVFMRGSDKRKI